MKLISTDQYLLLIDEEAEIKESNILSLYKNNRGGEILCISYLSKAGMVFHELDIPPIENYGTIEGGITPLKDEINKIIAFYPLKEAKELDLPLLPNPFEINIDELSTIKGKSKGYYGQLFLYKEGFFDGHKAAQPKQFSLEDMEAAVAFGMTLERFRDDQNKLSIDKEFEGFIQSLSTQQLPIDFLPEYESIQTTKKEDYQYSNGKSNINFEKRLKTITNSEGKQVIQGTYKY